MNRRIVIGVIFACSLLIFGLMQFFAHIQANALAEEREAALTAYQKTIIAKVTKVDSFIADVPYKIVFGEDAIGQQVIVWLGDTDIHTEYVADGIKEKELKAQFLKKEPAAKLLRILPGKFQNTYIWELFYQKKDSQGQQNYYYDYVTFKEGILLDTYNLGTDDMNSAK